MYNQVKPVKVFPDPEDETLRKDIYGNFDYSAEFLIYLFTRTPGATIYYSLEKENAPGAQFIPYDPQRGIMLTPPPFGDTEETEENYILKAYGMCQGMENSPLLVRHYRIVRKPYNRTTWMPLIDSGGIKVPGAFRIIDYANDNMFLFLGEKANLLYDTGFYAKGGDLRKVVLELAGSEKPLYVVHSHNGPDHIQMTWQFVGKEKTDIYINARDRYMLEENIRLRLSLPDNEETKSYLANYIHDLCEGDTFDLGGRCFRAIEMPGHSFGCVALLDEEHGDFLVGDCIGTNWVQKYGSLWMWNIVPRVPINDYLSILHIFIDKIRFKNIKEVYGGHYNRVTKGTHLFTYLDNLMIACEKLVDYGLSATEIAQPFPPRVCVVKSLVGDQFVNPYYASVVTNSDIMFDPEYLDGNEEKNADLCHLIVSYPGEEENLLVTQAESGLGVSLNFVYRNVSPSPKDILEEARVRIEHPSYRVKVKKETEFLDITPITASHFSKVYVNGEPFYSDYKYRLKLTGELSQVDIRVISEDGSAERHYTIRIQRENERKEMSHEEGDCIYR